MAQIFRQIVNRQAWEKGEEIDGVPAGESPADILNSFRTEQSGLSIYIVGDDVKNLGQLIAAYCAKRSKIQHLDYVLLKEEDVGDLGLQLKDVPGEVADAQVSAWHRDVVNLSINSLSAFASRAHDRGEVKRVSNRDVGVLVNQYIASGNIDPTTLQAELREEIGKEKYRPKPAA